MELNSYEMEFIAQLCEVLTTKECNAKVITPIWVEDGDTGCLIFSEEAQDIINDLYDTYESMYINVVKIPMGEAPPQEQIDDHLIKLANYWGMSW